MEFLFMSISLFDGVSSAGIPEPRLPSFIESAGDGHGPARSRILPAASTVPTDPPCFEKVPDLPVRATARPRDPPDRWLWCQKNTTCPVTV